MTKHRLVSKLPGVLPDTLMIILASCLAILIGLPVNYKYQFSPLYCTLANATFIIACGTAKNMSLWGNRVLQCIAGFAIGYAVNYLIVPVKDRYQRIIGEVGGKTKSFLENLDFSTYMKWRRKIETQMELLREDSEKGLKKHRHTEGEMGQKPDISLTSQIFPAPTPRAGRI